MVSCDESPDDTVDIGHGAIEAAMVDEWHFRVTLTDGRVVICGCMTSISQPGFVHLRPVQDDGVSPDNYWFDGPENKRAYVLQERGMDVAWVCISSVEWGIS